MTVSFCGERIGSCTTAELIESSYSFICDEGLGVNPYEISSNPRINCFLNPLTDRNRSNSGRTGVR